MGDILAKVVKDDNDSVKISENKSVRILMIYPDVHSGNKRHFDVYIQRISMEIYIKLPHKMRGNQYQAVYLMQGVTRADLETYPESLRILTDTLLSTNGKIITM